VGVGEASWEAANILPIENIRFYDERVQFISEQMRNNFPVGKETEPRLLGANRVMENTQIRPQTNWLAIFFERHVLVIERG